MFIASTCMYILYLCPYKLMMKKNTENQAFLHCFYCPETGRIVRTRPWTRVHCASTVFGIRQWSRTRHRTRVHYASGGAGARSDVRPPCVRARRSLGTVCGRGFGRASTRRSVTRTWNLDVLPACVQKVRARYQTVFNLFATELFS